MAHNYNISPNMIEKLRIDYNIAAIRSMTEANESINRLHYLKPRQQVLLRNHETGKFTTNRDHFVVDFNDIGAEIANESTHTMTRNIRDIFPIKGWIIGKPEQAWWNLQNCKQNERKTLLKEYTVTKTNRFNIQKPAHETFIRKQVANQQKSHTATEKRSTTENIEDKQHITIPHLWHFIKAEKGNQLLDYETEMKQTVIDTNQWDNKINTEYQKVTQDRKTGKFQTTYLLNFWEKIVGDIVTVKDEADIQMTRVI